MALQKLRSFCLVYEKGSFNQAAEALFLSQSAVSQQIGTLEKQYGVTLFRRMGRKIQPTPEGKALYEWACQVLSSFDSIPERFRAMKNLEYGDLDLLATPLTASEILPPILQRFHYYYPDIRIRIHCLDDWKQFQELGSDHIDVILVEECPRRDPNPLFELSPFGRDRLVLVAGPDHRFSRRMRTTPEDLPREFFIHCPGESPMRYFVEDFLMQNGLNLTDYMEAGSHHDLKRLIEEGTGIAIVSALAVRRELESGALVEVPLENLSDMSRSFLFGWPRKQEPSYSVWAFRKFFDEFVEEGKGNDLHST